MSHGHNGCYEECLVSELRYNNDGERRYEGMEEANISLPFPQTVDDGSFIGALFMLLRFLRNLQIDYCNSIE